MKIFRIMKSMSLIAEEITVAELNINIRLFVTNMKELFVQYAQHFIVSNSLK